MEKINNKSKEVMQKIYVEKRKYINKSLVNLKTKEHLKVSVIHMVG